MTMARDCPLTLTPSRSRKASTTFSYSRARRSSSVGSGLSFLIKKANTVSGRYDISACSPSAISLASMPVGFSASLNSGSFARRSCWITCSAIVRDWITSSSLRRPSLSGMMSPSTAFSSATFCSRFSMIRSVFAV
jgi:hypothetical protein